MHNIEFMFQLEAASFEMVKQVVIHLSDTNQQRMNLICLWQ